MRDYEIKLAAMMLNMAADEFANHGCNDFDLVKDGGLTEAQAKEFKANAERWAGDGEDEPIDDGPLTGDWIVMNYLAYLLDPEAD